MTQRTVALYLRVSTGEQTVDNQRRELLAAAERRGWQVVAEFCDNGISGANGRDKRPGFDKLCRAVVRHQFDVVAAWSGLRRVRAQHHSRKDHCRHREGACAGYQER
jgi:DNA invertase Pin-like site-specific DNA recombinase